MSPGFEIVGSNVVAMSRVSPVFMCRQCFAREVARKDRPCHKCVEIRARREQITADRARERQLRVVLFIVGSLGIFVAAAAAFGGK